MEIPPVVPQNTKQPRTVLAFILIVLIVAVILVGLWALFFRARDVSQAGPMEDAIPEYFVPSASKSRAVAIPPADLELLPKQSAEPGVEYILEKSYDDALREYYGLMKANGWVAVGGSNQADGRTVFKVNDGTLTFFIVIERIQENPPQSKVSMIPVTDPTADAAY